MARRSFDFKPADKIAIIAAYNNVCAACGADDYLVADHWIAGDEKDSGVCLCQVCNGAKYNARVTEKIRLSPRIPFADMPHSEYKKKIADNRNAFAKWIASYRGITESRAKAMRIVQYVAAH